jgi:hypothetical protein
MVEETDPGRDIDGLSGGITWLAVKIDKHFNLCLVGFPSNNRGAITCDHHAVGVRLFVVVGQASTLALTQKGLSIEDELGSYCKLR